MRKDITTSSTNDQNKSKEKVVAPSDSSLNFLKQLARSFNVEKQLPSGLKQVFLN